MPDQISAVLPIAHGVLRILIVVNWLLVAFIAALLGYSFVNEPWAMRAFGLAGFPDSQSVMTGMRAIAALGLIAFVLHYVMLKRLLAIVGTVRLGDPFVPANAIRLQAIAWVLLALQLLGLGIAGIENMISSPAHQFNLDAGFSTSGWLAVILTFVLARVFAKGTLLRDDVEGTV